ncbi:glycoside hydrolase [Jannaschia sp. S6380]|uniref:sialidase family protein n=1 Tax=Jannaschia sp. S6380 TaxID=2926408 RepID=UPI001FF68D21|nr:sialidase family protein [Jannaschia sp. S6380]MCK0166686.1 glycoside hydrolase [Jannaschia sp. S6380]
MTPHPVAAQMSSTLFEQIEDVPAPSPPGAHEPSLTDHEDTLYMSWMEQVGPETRVMMAVRTGEGWSVPRLVQQGDDLFVNWADFPGIAVFEDGTIAVHWLREIGPSSFDYQVEISLSHDGGTTWGQPLIPHDDRSFAQHGFASMWSAGQSSLAVIWLDGRAYGAEGDKALTAPDAMQLRATMLTSEGMLGDDVAIDLQTCSCCQTSLAATGDGTILAAYRDRTEGEIRDISVARLTEKGWETPVSVHDDGWELSGCPVNGPAIDAEGGNAAVAWFTGANDVAAVKVAFSDNGGRDFDTPVRIDQGNPVGRVDLELLDDGTALTSWVEWVEGNEALYLCKVHHDAGCISPEILTINSAGASVNFPRMARLGREVYLAWTQPDENGDSIAIRRAVLAERN